MLPVICPVLGVCTGSGSVPCLHGESILATIVHFSSASWMHCQLGSMFAVYGYFFLFTHNSIEYPSVLVQKYIYLGEEPNKIMGMWLVEPNIACDGNRVFSVVPLVVLSVWRAQRQHLGTNCTVDRHFPLALFCSSVHVFTVLCPFGPSEPYSRAMRNSVYQQPSVLSYVQRTYFHGMAMSFYTVTLLT